MGLLELCLLPMLLPQEPPPAATAPEAAVTRPDPATWLPAEALAAITFRGAPLTSASAELWQRLQGADPTGLADRVKATVARALAEAGLQIEDLADLQQGGIAAALLGFANDGMPRFAAAAHAPQRAAALQQAFDRFVGASGAVATTVAGRQSYQITLGGFSCHAGVFGDHLVIASDSPTLAEVLSKTQQETASSLAAAQDYAATRSAVGCDQAQCTVFLRPKRLFREASGFAPPAQRKVVDRIGQALSIETMERAMLRIGLQGEHLDCGAAFTLQPGPGLLTALLGDGKRLTGRLAEAVPPTAQEFSFSTIDLGAVVTAGLALAGSIDANAGRMVDGQIAALSEKAGADLRADLLAGCSGQIVAVRFASGYGVSFGLRDGAKFGRALAGLLEATGAPVQALSIAGAPAHRLAAEAGAGAPLCFAVLGNWLCLADRDDNLAELVRQHAAPGADPDAAAALLAAPAGTTMLQQGRSGGDRASMTIRDGVVVVHSRMNLAAAAQALAGGAAPATSPGAAATEARAPAADVAALQQAAKDPQSADLTELERLAGSANVAVAARAAWLLADQKRPEAIEVLERIALTSTVPEVRLQAMHGLFRGRNVTSVAAAIAGLEDADSRVRTVAAQVLGKLRRPAAKAPLLALLNRNRTADSGTTPAIDAQAALLALCDMEAVDQLLAAATAVQTHQVPGAGQALTFYFQTLSPRLPQEDEATLLVAVLAHREAMLRRYAISRLGELGNATTAAALEGRLAGEGDELRPLVEVALARVRDEAHLAPSLDDGGEEGVLARVQRRWAGLTAGRRLLLLGLCGGSLVMMVLVLVVLVRQRRARELSVLAMASAALVEPSAGHGDADSGEAGELAAAADSLIDQSAPAEAGVEESDGTAHEDSTPTEDGALAEDEVVLQDDAERRV